MVSRKRPAAHRHEPKKAGAASQNSTKKMQQLHTLVWRSYLQENAPLPNPDPSGGPTKPPPVSEPNPTKPAPPSVANGLQQSWADIPKLLLGMAVWNQVPKSDPSSPTTSHKLDPAIEPLVEQLFGLDATTVYSVRANPLYDAVPPYPDQIVLDAHYKGPPGTKTIGTLDVSVPIPHSVAQNTSQPTTLGCLALMAHPHTWSACSLFWSDIEQTPPTRTGVIKARLQLPGDDSAGPVAVTIHISKFSSGNPFRTELKFTIQGHPFITACDSYIVVRKEPGRPGAARVINHRVVEFTPESSLAKYAAETLRYWLQAETVSVLDELVRSARGGDT